MQGSGIGPVVLTFINELADLLDSTGVTVKLFADHVEVYVWIVAVGKCDADMLQHALESLASWADTWQLTISVEKCSVLNIGHICFPDREFKNK